VDTFLSLSLFCLHLQVLLPFAVTALEHNSRSIDADGQSDAVRGIEIATPVAGFIWITTCSRWMIEYIIILHKRFERFYVSA